MDRMEVLRELRNGAEAWNKWRSDNALQGSTNLSLARADLRNRNLAGINFYGVDLTQAQLTGANLDGANLGDSKLIDAILVDVSMKRASLNAADCRGAVLKGADLRYADMSDAKFNNADLTDAKLSGARLLRAIFTNAIVEGEHLTDRQRSEAVDILVTSNRSDLPERNELVIAWNPEIVSPEDYALLVASLGDLVRAHGGIGVVRRKSQSLTIEVPAGVFS